jgi:tetratricopeptide (TPR) repeat protein
MSPEQSTGERTIDGRSDTYSLACVLFELLAGEPPFTGVSAAAVIAKRFAGPTPSVRLVRDTVPVGVDRAIARALARVPADRFATSGEFARALEANVELDSSRLRRRSIAIATGGIVVAAIGAILWATRVTGGSHAPVPDSVAVSLVARARQQADRRTVDGTQRALQLYQQAIARDSDYVDAWAGIARTLQFALSWQYPVPGLSADSIIPVMVRASNRALELDSNSVQALVSKSQVLRVVDPVNLAPRFEIVNRALKLDSTSVDAWFQLGNLWQDSLELHHAIDAYHRGATIRPRHSNSLAFMAFAYCWLRKPDSALIWADSAARVDPSNVFGRQAVGFARRGLGQWNEARPSYEAVVRVGNGPDQIFGYAGLAELAWRRGDRAAADNLLTRAAASIDTLNPTVHDAVYLAWGYAETDHRERALRLLERFEPVADAHFQLHLLREPMLDTLRSLPRFRALITKAR